MDRVTVALGDRSYSIVIGHGILTNAGNLIKNVVGQTSKVLLVSNPTIFAHYGKRALTSLRDAGLDVVYAEVPDGEEYKSLEQAQRLYDSAVDNLLDRYCTVVSLSGGVIGDLGGFVAATYQRGVNFVQIPTTLLAQVDSSVGGKVAVNHARAKNMIGVFHQPRIVIIDPEVLDTLLPKDFLSGLAEVVKYGIIQDPGFFDYLESNIENIVERRLQVIEYIIKRSCEIKAEVVGQDEREEGRRAILNLGHTFGHAVESYAGYGTYSHGEAVAIGIALAAELACDLGMLDNAKAQRIKNLMIRMGMSIKLPDFPVDKLLGIMYQDKKVKAGALRLVLPVDIGQVVIKGDVSDSAIVSVMDKGKDF
ncbi:MAG: 3-dehydroquinate synthase [Acidobacteriota bacterium]